MTDNKQDTSNSSEDEFERITPARINPGAPAQASSAPSRRQGVPAVAVWLALGLLLVLVVGVFLWLPRQQAGEPVVAQAPPAAVTSVEKSAELAAEPAPPPLDVDMDADALLDKREQAQALAGELSAKREKLSDKSVQRWAASDFEQLESLAGQAQAQFDGRNYGGAIKSYEKAITQADALLAKAQAVLDDALARGAQAIKDENSAAAASAYELALAIAPDNAQARKGLARAQSLDAVLATMAAGLSHEQAGDLAQARRDYQSALDLDGAYAPAQEALHRVSSALAGREFAEQMSRGLAALERGDFAAAKTAFQAATRIRPGDASAADGLARANAGLRDQAIARHRQEAEAAVANEQWRQALDAYNAALKLDASLAFAQAGKARAASRLQLDQKLQFHLDNPQRLSDEAARQAAEAQLAEARAVADPGPRLRGQIEKLSQLVAAMRRPVPVQLVSDGRTQVLVYHVGDLGAFERKQLQLTPGEYTMIGRCPGYRDLRRIITVKADQASVGPITIRCEEKL